MIQIERTENYTFFITPDATYAINRDYKIGKGENKEAATQNLSYNLRTHIELFTILSGEIEKIKETHKNLVSAANEITMQINQLMQQNIYEKNNYIAINGRLLHISKVGIIEYGTVEVL